MRAAGVGPTQPRVGTVAKSTVMVALAVSWGLWRTTAAPPSAVGRIQTCGVVEIGGPGGDPGDGILPGLHSQRWVPPPLAAHMTLSTPAAARPRGLSLGRPIWIMPGRVPCWAVRGLAGAGWAHHRRRRRRGSHRRSTSFCCRSSRRTCRACKRISRSAWTSCRSRRRWPTAAAAPRANVEVLCGPATRCELQEHACGGRAVADLD